MSGSHRISTHKQKNTDICGDNSSASLPPKSDDPELTRQRAF